MRIARVGQPAAEKPAIVYDDGRMRDVSILLTEIDVGFVQSDWHRALTALDPDTMPEIDPAMRVGPCLGGCRRVFATGPLGADPTMAGAGLSLAIVGGSAQGAGDPLPLPASRTCMLKGGIAAVIRRSPASPPTVGGFFLYLHAVPLMPDQPDLLTRAAAATRNGLLSIGPWLLDPRDCPAREPIRPDIAVNGIALRRPSDDPGPERLAEEIARIDSVVDLTSGDVLLFGARDAPGVEPPVTCLSPGDVVSVRAAGFGFQQRICVEDGQVAN
jgi:hypothetical protein